jgi:hypothetical protein
MTPTTSNLHAPVGFEPARLLAACAFPGLGHFLAGDKPRAAAIAAGVMGLFTTGLLVGGIDAIDRKEDAEWFIAQAFVGPAAIAVDWFHQNRCKVADAGHLRSALPFEGRDPITAKPLQGGTPPNQKSVGKMNEIGTLAVALAGMVNLIAIIDAGFPTRRRTQPNPANA